MKVKIHIEDIQETVEAPDASAVLHLVKYEAGRRAILNHFGSPEAFLSATQEELEGFPGVPAKTGRDIYAQLHKAGRG